MIDSTKRRCRRHYPWSWTTVEVVRVGGLFGRRQVCGRCGAERLRAGGTR